MPHPHRQFEEAIKENYGCNSHWLRSITVAVDLGNQLRWRDIVQVFCLHDYVKAEIAYAWTYRARGEDKVVTVLGVPPIDSAQAAVKSVIGDPAAGN